MHTKQNGVRDPDGRLYRESSFTMRNIIGIYLYGRKKIMKDWLESIDACNRAQSKYDKKNTSGFYMKLNIRTDADIIRWLWKQPSKQGAVKRLIREEIARGSSRTAEPNQNPAGIIT